MKTITDEILEHIDNCAKVVEVQAPEFMKVKGVPSIKLPHPDRLVFGTTRKGIALLMSLRGHFWPFLRTRFALYELVRVGILVKYTPGERAGTGEIHYRRPWQP